MSVPARKPYRKASDYLGTNNKPAVERNPSKSANDTLNNHAHVDLKRKIEILTAEFEQRREYLENELQISHRNQQKTEEQIKNLQASYISLQQKNVTLEEQLDKMVYVEKENEMLNREIEGLTNKLSDSKNALRKAQEDNERLRKDCNAAVQLLKCHPSNFQAPQQNKLPIEIQEKVETYKVQAQDYHEYINPYDDSDSDSDQEDLKPSSAHRVEPQLPHPANSTVPFEFLANVLEKPEHVYLNLEPSDYIHDPALTSLYKPGPMARTLIKPDYEAMKEDDSSPWQRAPTLGVTHTHSEDNDETSAGAYGAYSVSRKRHPFKTDSQPLKSIPATSKPTLPISKIPSAKSTENPYSTSLISFTQPDPTPPSTTSHQLELLSLAEPTDMTQTLSPTSSEPATDSYNSPSISPSKISQHSDITHMNNEPDPVPTIRRNSFGCAQEYGNLLN